MSFCCQELFYYIGLLFILKQLTQILKHTIFYYFEQFNKIDYPSMFGKKSYALITGCTAGIGLSWAEFLASKQMNLVLWSRNPTKLDFLRQRLIKQYPGIDIKVIAKDFSTCHESSFFKTALKEVESLDISILVNNVGVIKNQRISYYETTADQIVDTININMISQAVLSSIFTPKMLERESKSAIIDISSMASKFLVPNMNIYASSKHFNEYLTTSLESFYSRDKIKFLAVCPGPVDTQIAKEFRAIEGIKKDPWYFKYVILCSRLCVRGSVSMLGKGLWSGGCLSHSIMCVIIESLACFMLLLDSFYWIGKFLSNKITFRKKS